MINDHSSRRSRRHVAISALAILAILAIAACTPKVELMTETQLTQFATRYAAAWSSQNPQQLAANYTDGGSLRVNGGVPAVGRAAIAEKAGAFMAAFPDMVVRMDSVRLDGRYASFHWTWTGTNTGPGGTGRPVRITGREEWTLSADGLIAVSDGHYDEAEYQRQVSGDSVTR